MDVTIQLELCLHELTPILANAACRVGSQKKKRKFAVKNSIKLMHTFVSKLYDKDKCSKPKKLMVMPIHNIGVSLLIVTNP